MSSLSKFCSDAEKTKEENKNKIVLSNADFALIEAIYALCSKLEELRLR